MKSHSLKVYLLLLFIFSTFVWAGESKESKISGLVFGDYYYIFSNHDSNLKNMNGVWLRRVYFTYDQGLTPNLDMRLRLEMAHPGDFKTKSAAVPFVKDAYLKYSLKKAQFYLGVSPTPTFALIEKMWGYRSVEKTPADLYKLGSSRETGLAVKGKIGTNNQIFYHAMVGNGNGQKGETNKYKKIMASVGSNLTSYLAIEGYADFEQRSSNEKRYSYQGFVAFHQKSLTTGLQFLHQSIKYKDQKDADRALLSAFVRARLQNQLTGFLRIDKLFNKLSEGPEISYLPVSDKARPTLAILGIDYAAAPGVHLIPNIEVVTYDDTKIDNDFVSRITFFYKFSQ